MKFQLIGLITNGGRRKELNESIEHFNAVASELREYYPEATVYNPADYQDENKTWEDYMEDCVYNIFYHRPTIYLLKGWEESQGARLEEKLAKRLNLDILEER